MDAQEKAGQLNRGEQGMEMPLAVATPTDPPGGKGKENLINKNRIVKVPRPNSEGFRRGKVNSQKIAFAYGIRIGRMIIFDIRWNASVVPHKVSVRDFPGRIWGIRALSNNPNYRNSWFYYDWGQSSYRRRR